MKIAVLIPSYRRPQIVRLTFPTWTAGGFARYLVVVADSPVREELEKYELGLKEVSRSSSTEVVYELYEGRRGSVRARNRLLEIASELGVDCAVMADDDYIMPRAEFIREMCRDLVKYDKVGAVGGRVVMARKRGVDPDFFLNLPFNLADSLTKLTGFVFLDVKHGPRYAEFLTPFYALRGDLAKAVRYASIYGGTAYREESDVHMQIKSLGYRLLLNPRYLVVHLGLEEGGNRPSMSMSQRMYWKARNHVVFLSRWSSRWRKAWYLAASLMLLVAYRPWYFRQIDRGLRDGLRLSAGFTEI